MKEIAFDALGELAYFFFPIIYVCVRRMENKLLFLCACIGKFIIYQFIIGLMFLPFVGIDLIVVPWAAQRYSLEDWWFILSIFEVIAEWWWIAFIVISFGLSIYMPYNVQRKYRSLWLTKV